MQRLLLLACLSLPFSGALGESLPSFEVASVKPFDRIGQVGHGRLEVSGPRVTMTGYTLSALIVYAYDLRNYQISGGPGWITSDGFTIAAKAEGETAPEIAEIRKMLQSLLSDRFGLKLHRETKELRVYNLVSAKAGPTLTPSKAQRATMQMGAGRMFLSKFTTAQFASVLSGVLSRPVLDQTGMTGEFDFTLESPDINMARMPPPPEDFNGPSIFTAIQEQLGLRLDPARGPIEILVVDQADRPIEN